MNLALLALAALLAQDKIKVATTLPTLEAIVREVGGDKVETFSLAKTDQDPHFVSPTPVLMKRVSEADLFFQVGMQLEGWADEVANGSGNSKIQKGQSGRVTLSTGIPKEEVPTEISRTQGDLHPEGNPHVWLDPVRVKLMAASVADALSKASPGNKDAFDKNCKAFCDRIDKALFGDELLELVGTKKLSRLALDGKLWGFLDEKEVDGVKLIEKAGGWLKRARPLRGQKVVEFHKVWVYTAKLLGMEIVGTIEEKPGIAPGPRYQQELTDRMKGAGVKLILVDNFYSPDLPRAIGGEAGARTVILANQCAGDGDYFKFVDALLDAMLEGLK